MAIENPTKYVSVQRLGRFKEKLEPILAEKATKTELTAATIIPVDLDSMTPTTTFQKNSILFINGVGYRAKQDTTHFPVVMVVQDGQFVYDIVDGAPAYWVSDYTLDEDWEVWGDAGIPRTLQAMQESIDTAIEKIEADQAAFIQQATTLVNQSLKLNTLIANTAGTRQYTVMALLTALADLMDKIVVADPAPSE